MLYVAQELVVSSDIITAMPMAATVMPGVANINMVTFVIDV
ncbi:MAG TPA: hypothetical protein VH593_16585 [Ktedonobacteraceae bacterium]